MTDTDPHSPETRRQRLTAVLAAGVATATGRLFRPRAATGDLSVNGSAVEPPTQKIGELSPDGTPGTAGSSRPPLEKPWLHEGARVPVLLQGQGVHGGTVTRLDEQCLWLRWDVGVWTQKADEPTSVDQFNLDTLTDTAEWIRARILSPDEGVAVPAEPPIDDTMGLTRWPYVELPVAVAAHPCTIWTCRSHSTGEPFDPGPELVSWLRNALSDFDCGSALFPKLASRLSYAHNARRPEEAPPFNDAYYAFAFTHVPLVDAAEIASLPAWTVPVEPGAPTLAQLHQMAQEHPDDGVLLDLDVRPAEDLAPNERPDRETTWLIRVTDVYDQRDCP